MFKANYLKAFLSMIAAAFFLGARPAPASASCSCGGCEPGCTCCEGGACTCTNCKCSCGCK